MKSIILPLAAALLSGCLTLSGTYVVSANKADGSAVPLQVTTHGSGIYSARNGFCSAHPQATVTIIDAYTGAELASESPYQCR